MAGNDGPVGLLEQPPERMEVDARAPAWTPSPASPAQDVSIGSEAPVMEVLRTTRAMRHLAPDPVPDELIRTVIEAATWAANGRNAQVMQFLVVTDRSTIARLAPLWAAVIDDWRTLVYAADILETTPQLQKIAAAIDYQRDHFAETPALIVVCEDEAAERVMAKGQLATLATLVRRVGIGRTLRLGRGWQRFVEPSLAGSFYPGVQNLLLAARAHGLAAVLTTWHLFREEEFKSIVGLPKEVKTWAVIPIGWPIRRFGPVNRRPVEEVIHRDRW